MIVYNPWDFYTIHATKQRRSTCKENEKYFTERTAIDVESKVKAVVRLRGIN